MKTNRTIRALSVIGLAVALASCSAADDKGASDGKNGIDGRNGTDGQNGTDGRNGTDGKDGTLPTHQISTTPSVSRTFIGQTPLFRIQNNEANPVFCTVSVESLGFDAGINISGTIPANDSQSFQALRMCKEIGEAALLSYTCWNTSGMTFQTLSSVCQEIKG